MMVKDRKEQHIGQLWKWIQLKFNEIIYTCIVFDGELIPACNAQSTELMFESCDHHWWNGIYKIVVKL